MRERSELLAILQTAEQIFGLSLIVIATGAALTAFFILAFRVPAPAAVLQDGYRRAKRERDAAIFMKERSPLPFFVEDHVQFVARGGLEVRATLLRLTLRSDPPSVVRYSPSAPHRVTGISPLRCFALCLASLATLAWLWW